MEFLAQSKARSSGTMTITVSALRERWARCSLCFVRYRNHPPQWLWVTWTEHMAVDRSYSLSHSCERCYNFPLILDSWQDLLLLN